MIFTFYSYKGGVGRSMAMANVAEWLYQQDKKVIMIDWDLEAPGIEGFFYKEDQLDAIRSNEGLIDMLYDYKLRFTRFNLALSKAGQELDIIIRRLLQKLKDSEIKWDEIITVLNNYSTINKTDVEAIRNEINQLCNKGEINISEIAEIFMKRMTGNIDLVETLAININDKLQLKDPEWEAIDIYLAMNALLDKNAIPEIVSELKKATSSTPVNDNELQNALAKYLSVEKFKTNSELVFKGKVPFKNYLQLMHPEEPSGGPGRLWLLSAGLRSGEENFTKYSGRVQDFSWSDFYASYNGENYFEWMRKQLESIADVILIDSRTGISEMNGVSTRQLSDLIVIVTAPNPQNLNGATNMIKSFVNKEVNAARKGRELKVVVVPSRVDFAESLFRNQFEAKFHTNLSNTAIPNINSSAFWELGIPYIPYYNYVEELAVGLSSNPDDLAKSGKSRDLDKAYRKLSDYLLTGTSDTALISPYVGERAFQIQDAPLFYGRSQEISRMMNIVSQYGFLILSGPSGSGKSSILAAGLIPLLKNSITKTDAPEKVILFLRPDMHPLQTLVTAIATEMCLVKTAEEINEKAAKLTEAFMENPGFFNKNIQLVFQQQKQFTIIIDQFEDVFTLCADAKERLDFIRILSAWVALKEAVVILSVRSDFAEELFAIPGIKELSEQGVMRLGIPNERELKEIMQESAGKAGLRFEKGLPDRIIKDMGGVTSKLSLLQSTLKELWANRTENALTFSGYEKFGGVNGILNKTYENIFKLFSYKEMEVARPVIIDKLINSTTRARLVLRLKKDEKDIPANNETKKVLQPFISRGLMIIDTDDSSGDETIEIANDTIVALWPQMNVWLKDKFISDNRIKRADKEVNNSETKLELINKARLILRGSRNLNNTELKQLCKDLEKHDQFAYATEILLIILEEEEKNGILPTLKSYQTLTKYIYKDTSLPSSFKFEKALNVLQSHDDLSKTSKCESLGLAGAIYKRKWQFDHQSRNLLFAKYYYERGYKQWKFFISEQTAGREYDADSNDDGYTAINYAYTNELIVVDRLEELSKFTGVTADILDNIKEAKETREYVLTRFIDDLNAPNPVFKKSENMNPWIIATVAEAYFGLRQYDNALKFFIQYINLEGLNQWEIRSFSQQIFSLAYFQVAQKVFFTQQIENRAPGYEQLIALRDQVLEKKINDCLQVFMEIPSSDLVQDTAVEIKKSGKLGLALSGGGFRASLFHIGVMAALAEKDELRNIEVLSCVSGGSIIGAYYYIKLKKLLEDKTDEEITRDDYIKLVQETEKDFLKGVQKNLRMRIFTNLGCNFKMLVNKNYSRTHRLGELYEEHLYKQLWKGDENIYMNDLFITPKETEGNFDITTDNWKRRNKVPQLILNATSVNTGHNWQFTASWMGEPPGNIQADIDVKPRLRRMYYKEAPEQYRKFKLGYAVGASSCVPVMFHPMPMFKLYPEIDLQLIDGGLHDNQGIAALIEQECTNMIISDASGQLSTNKIAAANAASLFYRADNILQERLRELQFMDIKERNYTAQLNQLITLHLKKDLQQKPENWLYCVDPPRLVVYESLYQDNKQLTSYGILKSAQTLLSNIRTDLDSFSDAEAYALMYSGYFQAHYEWNERNNAANTNREESLWNFSKIRDYVTIPEKADKIKKVLDTGRKQFFKLPDLNLLVKISSIVFLLGIVGLLGYYMVLFWKEPLVYITAKSAAIFIGLFIVGILCRPLGILLNLQDEIKKWLILFAFATIGFLIFTFYVLFLNPLYNLAGKIKS